MRAMKDSGIEWIGEIPASWEIERLKYHIEFNPTTDIPEYEDDQQISFLPMECLRRGTHTSQVVDYEKVKKGYVNFQDGDVLMAKVTPCLENGNIAIAQGLINGVGFGSTEINVIRCTSIHREYLFYMLQCKTYIERAVADMYGVAGLKRLNPSFIPNTKYPIPSIAEQERIAEYLNRTCREFDALIEAKEKTNALLRERRQSIIYKAVTKGLDPAVPMKDSGIEWIGMIPESWGTRKIKYCFEVYAGATPKSGNCEFWDGDIIWVTPADYTTEQKYISAGRKNITQEGFESCSTELIPAGSLIFSKRAPIGLVAINTVDMCTNQGCLACVPIANNDVEYFYYAFSCFTEQFDLYGSGTTFKEISADAFMNFAISYPAPEAQRQISDYLRGKCAEMDTLISANEATIQKLKEYRQSVIYEAVTGKMEV